MAHLRELVERGPGAHWGQSQLVKHAIDSSSSRVLPLSLLGPPSRIDDPIDPGVLVDLALDRLFGAVTLGLEPFDLSTLFTQPLMDEKAISFRQAITNDLLKADARAPLLDLIEGLEKVERLLQLATRARQPASQQRWLLDAVIVYTETIQMVASQLEPKPWYSEGLGSLAESLVELSNTQYIRDLTVTAHSVAEGLAAIDYLLLVEDNAVTVRRTEANDSNYRDRLNQLFTHLCGPEVLEPTSTAPPRPTTHIDDQILAIVVRLFPEEFANLATFATDHDRFVAPWLVTTERELVFYLSWIEELLALQAQGLPCVVPTVSDAPSTQHVEALYDLALAHDLTSSGTIPVLNQWHLSEDEIVTIITGPNSSGKTTYARSVGQLYHLAALGLPVGATSAVITRAPTIATIFSGQEETNRLVGRLESEILQLQAFFAAAKEHSLLITNEILSSTSVDDAVMLGRLLIERCRERHLSCLIVSFVDELAKPEAGIVSLAAVMDELTYQPTLRFERSAPRTRALALELALRHGLIEPATDD